MILNDLVLPIFVFGFFLFVLLSITTYLACRTLQKMPDNKKEREVKNSWTGPEKSSHIIIGVSLLLFIASSILLAINEKIAIIFGLVFMTTSIMVLATTSMLAFAVIDRKGQLSAKTYADHNNGRQFHFTKIVNKNNKFKLKSLIINFSYIRFH